MSPFLRARALQALAWGLAVSNDPRARRAAQARLDWWFESGQVDYSR